MRDHRLSVSNDTVPSVLVGPIWIIARGNYLDNQTQMIDLFSERGEDVNELFGMAGSAMHAAIYSAWGELSTTEVLLNNLVEAGADPDIRGSQGTPLELAWRHLHNLYGSDHSQLVRAILWLLEHGGTNKQADPNDTVPTVERMRLVANLPRKYFYARPKELELLRKVYRGKAPLDAWHPDRSRRPASSITTEETDSDDTGEDSSSESSTAASVEDAEDGLYM